ncbi:MAG: hypothetical protein QCI00_07705 [Candidatus Thermoplasmatota archaeon]|nr:hypothetical protein [Candidatus Thermoplasmatota archaeon]
MKKILAMLICFAFIATIGTTASAQSDSITDPTGDVLHYREQDGRWSWGANIENKPNIDITEVKYVVTGDTISLSLTVAGTISTSEGVGYYAYLITSDSSYNFWHLGSEVFGMATSTGDGDFQYSDADITVSGNTITATYDVIGTFSTVDEFYGFANEYTVVGDQSSEWWTDYAPNDESPYQASDPDPSDPTDPDDPTDPSDPTGDTSGSLTDPANDVYIPGGQTGISNQQHLDIREISYMFDDSGLTLTMTLQGTVSDEATYTVTLETEGASYGMIYDYGGWSNVATSEAGEFLPYLPEDEAASVSGNTITVLFDRVGSSTTVIDFWGQALELGGARDDVPNENGGGTSGGSTSSPSNGTPGFELFALITAFAAIVFIIKKRK